MEYTIILTEEESIAFQTLIGDGEIQDWIQDKISRMAKNQVDVICASYCLDKLKNNQRIGFSTKKDIVMTAKNEGFLETQLVTDLQK